MKALFLISRVSVCHKNKAFLNKIIAIFYTQINNINVAFLSTFTGRIWHFTTTKLLQNKFINCCKTNTNRYFNVNKWLCYGLLLTLEYKIAQYLYLQFHLWLFQLHWQLIRKKCFYGNIMCRICYLDLEMKTIKTKHKTKKKVQI